MIGDLVLMALSAWMAGAYVYYSLSKSPSRPKTETIIEAAQWPWKRL